jgi:hypothetical protein
MLPLFIILSGVWLYLTVDVVSEVVHPVSHPLAVPALHQLISRYVHLMSNSDINYGMQIADQCRASQCSGSGFVSFWGFPDPLVRGKDPDPDPSIIKQK